MIDGVLVMKGHACAWPSQNSSLIAEKLAPEYQRVTILVVCAAMELRVGVL